MTEQELQLTAPVFNIQPYSIHDGPGIRVTVFVKGCPLRCLWCANPESHSAKQQLMFYALKCTGCGACKSICPENAITMEEKDGKHIAVTNRNRCIDCGKCENVCPSTARELVGKAMTVEEVLERVLPDKLFMDASGGGITISGGECAAYPAFTAALLKASKEAGMHTAVESSCFGSREAIDAIYQYVDLALLDIKHMDSVTHKEYTGVPNEIILENIRYIHNDLGVETMISVPVIPGYNDTDENISATAKFVVENLGNDVKIRLLPYHRLGESKNDSLGKKMNHAIEVPSAEHMQGLRALVESFGIAAQIGG